MLFINQEMRYLLIIISSALISCAAKGPEIITAAPVAQVYKEILPPNLETAAGGDIAEEEIQPQQFNSRRRPLGNVVTWN